MEYRVWVGMHTALPLVYRVWVPELQQGLDDQKVCFALFSASPTHPEEGCYITGYDVMTKPMARELIRKVGNKQAFDDIGRRFLECRAEPEGSARRPREPAHMRVGTG